MGERGTHVALVGMSGVGKSHWSGRLAAAGLERRDCGREVAAELGLGDTARGWLGLPFEPGFAEREEAFLHAESAVLTRILDELERATRPRVVDTTGSVVYLEPPLLERLRRATRVVHLDSSADSRARLFETFCREARPVVWRGLFRPAPGESRDTALSRCYGELLEARRRAYAGLAHVELAEEAHRDGALEPAQLLQMAREDSSRGR